MKTKTLFKIHLLILCVFVSSCVVLDETPFVQTDTANYYQNAEDALDGLTSAYARLKSGNGYYKQKYLSTLFAASDQGLSTFLLNNFNSIFFNCDSVKLTLHVNKVKCGKSLI